MDEAVCVHCGYNNPSIYKQFSNEIIKLTNCENCDEPVDEYVETEYSIIIIDMLLLRKEALRHVLFNSNIQVAWKLIVLFILCDAYEKIASSQTISLKDSFRHGNYINELELNFYLMCIKSFLDYFIFSALAVVVFYYPQIKNTKMLSSKSLFHGIIIASYGKLFMLPVLVWSKNVEYCETLIMLFIFLSQTQVLRVTTRLSSIMIVILLVIISKLCCLLLQYLM